MKLITAPKKIINTVPPLIFLAGSIDLGRAEAWQDKIVDFLKKYQGTLLNPRRGNWEQNQGQDLTNQKFKNQVTWEFKGLNKSDYIIMYFAPASQSPISLLELGLFAGSHKIICCCPHGFWRRGNVEFVCQKFKIPLTENFEELIAKLKQLGILKEQTASF